MSAAACPSSLEDQRPSETELVRGLVEIGIALTGERDLSALLERIVAEARRVTRAEAGTLFLRDGAALRFAVVQNEPLATRYGVDEMRRRLTAELLPLDEPSLAGWVASTGDVITVADAYAIPTDHAYRFNRAFDARHEFRTRSVLVVPLLDPSSDVLGVLQLINARDGRGQVVAFHPRSDGIVRALASQAAVAVRNAMLADLVFKDPLTGAYNRRYFTLRIEEEAKRYTRLGEPMSLVLIDLDDFKPVNDRHGHQAGDQVLRDVTRVLMENSRSFSIVTRYGGDEFAVLQIGRAHV